MGNNYESIIRNNLTEFYEKCADSAGQRLPATKDGDQYRFQAFGDTCLLSPDGIFLNGETVVDPRGIIISLYALHAATEPCRREPFKAYKEFPDTMPYAGAFHTHTEAILAPYTDGVIEKTVIIRERLNGDDAPEDTGGDLAFIVKPLPKIFLCYIFYIADEDFPASATCLYSSNADLYLPTDALADVGEYTSKKIIALVTT